MFAPEAREGDSRKSPESSSLGKDSRELFLRVFRQQVKRRREVPRLGMSECMIFCRHNVHAPERVSSSDLPPRSAAFIALMTIVNFRITVMRRGVPELYNGSEATSGCMTESVSVNCFG